MPINPYLWSASLETLSFMPLSSADPFGGTIFTDWYSSELNENERCKINVFITGAELKTQNSKSCRHFVKYIKTINGLALKQTMKIILELKMLY